MITDTDHYAPDRCEVLWTWKSFLRGHNPIAMDSGIKPRGELSSTGYALANPGEEYLVLQPLETTAGFTLAMKAGIYSGEWYSLATRKEKRAGAVSIRTDRAGSFRPPFAQASPTVLHPKRTHVVRGVL